MFNATELSVSGLGDTWNRGCVGANLDSHAPFLCPHFEWLLAALFNGPLDIFSSSIASIHKAR